MTPDPVGLFCTYERFSRVISVNMSKCKTVAVVINVSSYLLFVSSVPMEGSSEEFVRIEARLDPVLLHVLKSG